MSITHEEAVKAEQAQQILNSEIFKEVLENLKQTYIDAWLKDQDIDNVNSREHLHKSILLLSEIEKHLRIVAEKGKLTQSYINKIRNIV